MTVAWSFTHLLMCLILIHCSLVSKQNIGLLMEFLNWNQLLNTVLNMAAQVLMSHFLLVRLLSLCTTCVSADIIRTLISVINVYIWTYLSANNMAFLVWNFRTYNPTCGTLLGSSWNYCVWMQTDGNPTGKSDGVVVRQFQFTGWPGNAGLPSGGGAGLLSLLELLESWQQRSGNEPITVHCMWVCLSPSSSDSGSGSSSSSMSSSTRQSCSMIEGKILIRKT